MDWSGVDQNGTGLLNKFLLFSENIACRFADEIITDNRILKEYVKIQI